MMIEDKGEEKNKETVLTSEQEGILDMYIESLDSYFEDLKNAEKVQVEIETLHLKRILTK